MSKLAHSYAPTMNEIDRRCAIEDGNEDCLDGFSVREESLAIAAIALIAEGAAVLLFFMSVGVWLVVWGTR